MDIKDIPKIKLTPAGNKTVIVDIDTIETDEGWDNGYKKEADSDAGTGQADKQEPAKVNSDPVAEPYDRERAEGAETADERALHLLSAIETACRDLQKHEFSHEDKPEEARCPTVLHRLLWIGALEVCGRDAWDLTGWEQAPDPNGPKKWLGWDVISRLADLVVPGD